MPHTEKSRNPIVRPGHMPHFWRHADESWDGGIHRALKLGENRAHAGPATGWFVPLMASGQTLKSIMTIQCADHGTNKGEFIHLLGQKRQVFTDLDAGHVGRDGVEFATYLRWRFHLQIHHVLMRWTTGQEDHDHRFVGTADTGLRFSAQQSRQRDPSESHRPDAQKVTA